MDKKINHNRKSRALDEVDLNNTNRTKFSFVIFY